MKYLVKSILLLSLCLGFTSCMEYDKEDDEIIVQQEENKFTFEGEVYFLPTNFTSAEIVKISDSLDYVKAIIAFAGSTIKNDTVVDSTSTNKVVAVTSSFYFSKSRGLTGNYTAIKSTDPIAINKFLLDETFYISNPPENFAGTESGDFSFQDHGEDIYTFKFNFTFDDGKKVSGSIKQKFLVN